MCVQDEWLQRNTLSRVYPAGGTTFALPVNPRRIAIIVHATGETMIMNNANVMIHYKVPPQFISNINYNTVTAVIPGPDVSSGTISKQARQYAYTVKWEDIGIWMTDQLFFSAGANITNVTELFYNDDAMELIQNHKPGK